LRDLSEAEQIAQRGSMLICQSGAALERSHLYLAMGNVGAAREKLDDASPAGFSTPIALANLLYQSHDC